MISVIIPLYNRATLIGETIASLQQQTYHRWEAIVVDDESTDGSYEKVEGIAQQDERIKLTRRHRDPKGAPTCRNIGAELATGDYLIFLDSDDLLAPHCLEGRASAVRAHPDYDFLVFPMLMFKQHPYDQNIVWNIDTSESDLTRFLRVDAVWQTTCPIYKRTWFLKNGRFDEHLMFWQDYELHTRMLIAGATYKKFLHQPPDCFYRQHHQGTVSQAVDVSEARLTTMEYVYQKLHELLIKSPFNTAVNKAQVGSVVYWINMRWIEYHANYTKSKENWLYCYQSGIVTSYQYIAGYCFFFLKFWQQRSGNLKLLLRIIAKPFILFLPTVYRNRPVTTAKESVAMEYLLGPFNAEP